MRLDEFLFVCAGVTLLVDLILALVVVIAIAIERRPSRHIVLLMAVLQVVVPTAPVAAVYAIGWLLVNGTP